jgi:glycosyltransferase involved in cell wall biosynthesis
MPDATLHVVGPVAEILAEARKANGNGPLAERLRLLDAALDKAAAAGGVTLCGRLPRHELDRELAAASVFAFPCDPIAPCETFSVSIMECCKMGIPVVLSPADALESIYRGHVRMVPTLKGEAFAGAVAGVLTDAAEAETLSKQGRALASGYTFDKAAMVLHRIILQHAKRSPVAGLPGFIEQKVMAFSAHAQVPRMLDGVAVGG